MNNTCKRCGAPLKPGMKFCPNCGADVSSNNSTDDTKVKVHNTRENQDNPNTNPIKDLTTDQVILPFINRLYYGPIMRWEPTNNVWEELTIGIQ